jgi:hypothetical protein
MKIKTIKKIITSKLNDWLESITDESLRVKVKEELLLSGGSITSLLQGEPVNDFDLYIKSQDTLMELAKYYHKGQVLDGRRRAEYVKNLGRENMEIYSDSDDVGNGIDYMEQMVRYRTLKDDQVKLDIPSAGVRFEPKTGENAPKYQVAFLSQNAISLTEDIQIVLRFSGDSATIHRTFDFIHATNYFTFEEGLVTNIEALHSIISKDLKYQGSLYPLTSIIRIKKFLKRGWNIGAGEMLKIMFQISELDLTDPDILEEQLVGVDVAYFAKLIEILRGSKDKKVTSHFLNTIIDKVFEQHEDSEEGVKKSEKQ